ncbi:MAG: hypothetical protein J1G38_06585 [Clostridiales bacterium]|nr:hypothetical protein [Clostridiales bacterium]
MRLKKFIACFLSAVMFAAVCVCIAACGDGKEPPKKEPPKREIPYNAFYDATLWEYMTNNSGASLDTGEKPVSLADGSIRFYRANQAYELGDMTNDTISFMLKGTNDWSIWLNSSSKDNTKNNSYRLVRTGGELRLVISSSPNQAAAAVVSTYETGEWNRFDVEFSTDEDATRIEIFVNGERAELKARENKTDVRLEDDALYHYAPESFTTGGWFVVKVWYANDYVQLKPVELDDVDDVPVIAAIGDSITYGSTAGNVYTESYPAQMQTMLGKDYNVVNFGMSGRTARTDLPADGGNPVGWIDNLQWKGVQAIVPDIAIVKLGTNDSKTGLKTATTKENFRAAFERILDELVEVNPDMKIYICTSAQAYSSSWTINNGNITNIIVPVQRQVAEERGLPIIDLNEITKNKSKLFSDGIHPSTKGYTMLAEVISTVITKGVDGLTADYLSDIDARYNDVK